MHITESSAIKVMESNCYSLACTKTSVFQHHWFFFIARSTHKIRRHLDISRSVWLWINLLQQNSVQLCRTGLSGHNLTQLNRKHRTCLPPLLPLPPSSCPSSPTILVPLPHLNTNARQRVREKWALLAVMKILNLLDLYQGCHYPNIWCHKQG